MGGRAFSNGSNPLHTPRMPPKLYLEVRDQYISLLQRLFKHVASPIEAPSKADHGDIDIFVETPIQPEIDALANSSLDSKLYSERDVTRRAVCVLLQPERITRSGKVTILALPHPSVQDAFVQLDIQIFPSFTTWRWHLFQCARGGLWALFRMLLRPFGLVATDRGFFARDAEIEPANKDRSEVFLTAEPAEVLEYLGYEEKEFWSPPSEEAGADCESSTVVRPAGQNSQSFRDLESLFDFAARCRFFRKSIFRKRPGSKRRRDWLKKNATYCRFVKEYVPRLPDNDHGDSSNVSASVESVDDEATRKQKRALERQQVFDEVLNRWERRGEWKELRRKWEEDRDESGDKAVAKALKGEMWRAENEYAGAWIKPLGVSIQVKKSKEEEKEVSSKAGNALKKN